MVVDPLLDPEQPPTPGVIHALLGPAGPLWDDLVGRAATMGARAAITWDGPKDGWVLKLTRAGRPFATLTPSRGRFRALVILGRAQVEEVQTLPLGPRVRAIFDAARQHPDGRWLFLPVETAADVTDVATILETKLPPTIRAKVAATR